MTMLSEIDIRLDKVSKIYCKSIDHGRTNALWRILARPFSPLGRPLKSEFFALDNVSLQIAKGEKVAILGQDGSGKTTLAKLICGVTVATSGQMQVQSSVRYAQSKLAIERPLMTLQLYLETLVSFLGTPWGEIQKTVAQILLGCELVDKRKTRLRDLTDAQLKKVTLFAIYYVPAGIYLLDEVKWNTGDLEQAALSQATVLFFASNADQIPAAFNRVLILHQGKLIADENRQSAKEIFSKLLPVIEGTLPAPQPFPYEENAADMELPPQGLESVPSGMTAQTPPPPPRKGSGLVRIQKIAVKARNGEALPIVRTGDDVVIEIEYQASRPEGHEGRFTLANLVLEDENKQRLLGFPSDVLTTSLGNRIPGRGVFRCIIPKLPLLPGRFGITIALLIDGMLADKSVNEVFIDVETGNFFGSGKLPLRFSGPFCADFTWEASADSSQRPQKNLPGAELTL